MPLQPRPDRQLYGTPAWFGERPTHLQSLGLVALRRRAAALLIDLAVLLPVSFAVAALVAALGGSRLAVTVAGPLAIVALDAILAATAGRPGSTPGKRARGLVVTDAVGEPVSRQSALLHSLLRWPAGLASVAALWVAPIHDELLKTDVRRGG